MGEIRFTPQSVMRAREVLNNAGGYTFPVDKWTRLDRFLILGTESSTYYVLAPDLTVDNVLSVKKCVDEDGQRVVRRIVEISTTGRAPKNDPALFALALVCRFGDEETRRLAYQEMPKVARTGSDLLAWNAYCRQMKISGRGWRNANKRWYLNRSGESLAMQMVKYQNRHGWRQRDILRLTHPRPRTPEQAAVLNWSADKLAAFPVVQDGKTTWATNGLVLNDWLGNVPDQIDGEAIIWAVEKIKRAETLAEVVALIRDYELPREVVPTRWLNEPAVWEALLPHMRQTALLRNLGKMTAVGLVVPHSHAAKTAAAMITDEARLRAGRIHPFNVLMQLKKYELGYDMRAVAERTVAGDNRPVLSWTPVAEVEEALEAAFYGSFRYVEPTGKRLVIALDVSGSMRTPLNEFYFDRHGRPRQYNLPITAREAAAAMSMAIARSEPHCQFVAFAHRMIPIEITPDMRLGEVTRRLSMADFGGTDCALPMLWALGYNREPARWGFRRRTDSYKNEGNSVVEADAFVLFTDDETWYGNVKPDEALRQYRHETGIPAKSVVCAMTATHVSIADPEDAGMLDVVGMDSAVPMLVSDFVREGMDTADYG